MKSFIYNAIFIMVVLLFAVSADAEEQIVSVQSLKATAAVEGWEFEVGDNPALDIPLSKLAGAVEPKGWTAKGHEMPKLRERVELPAKWDWREQVKEYPGVRAQGRCGSCWAFGSTAIAEWTYVIQMGDRENKRGPIINFFIWLWNLITLNGCDDDDDPPPGPPPPPPPPSGDIDLSEQDLVSCSNHGSCWGGYFAHKWQMEKGMPSEADYPYTASNSRCKSGVHRPLKIKDYYYVADGNTPSVQEIKEAMIKYGPVAVTVTANGAMQGYKSGIFGGSACSGRTTNHIVTLIGWDDATETWIMQNSWGKKWGEYGYMRIKWGCSRIGERATVVTYK